MLDPNFTIPTSRLIISHLIPTNPAHISFIHTLNHEPTTQHAHQRQPIAKSSAQAGSGKVDMNDTQAFVEKEAKRMERIGFGMYLISLKDDSGNRGKTIGVVSMELARYAGAPTIPDVGFKVLPEFWGKGYATEAARATLEYYRREKGQEKFAGFCEADNESSIRMFRRLEFENRGVREVKGVRGDDVGTKCMVWTLGVGEREEDLRALGL